MADDIKKIIEETAEATANKLAQQVEPLRKEIEELGVLMEDVQSEARPRRH